MSELKMAEWADYTHRQWEPLPKPQEMGQKTAQNNWSLPEVDIRSQDVSDLDLSLYNMQDITFDDKTNWPDDSVKCPKGFTQLKKIVEYGKNPGLGIRSLHEKGIDGNGLSMAIIDQPLSGHIEYFDNLVHYEAISRNELYQKGSMHGSAVASIAVGKTCGVAPKAKLYYFAADNFASTDTGKIIYDEKGQAVLTAFYYAKALKRIIEINELLPSKEKIQVISVSWAGQANAKVLYSGAWLKTLERAKNAGIFVLTCASQKEYGLRFSGLGKQVQKDPELSSSYTDKSWGVPVEIEKNKDSKNCPQKHFEKTLLVPMDHRTVASPTGNEEYVHYFKGGLSWATPWLAAAFVLARQVDFNLTPEDFWKTAIQTGVLNERAGGVIIQPQKLIETLQKEKEDLFLKNTLQKGSDKMIQGLMKGTQNAK
ncbi:MAG: S8 family serine peptidase [Alphaproteobacteria bacterium]